jgi:4'-phosphopantetheinyl transferase
VWRFSCASLSDAERERGLQLLSPDELNRSRRFFKLEHRETFVAQRIFLRLLLSRYTGGAPGQLQFEVGPRGKPRLLGPEAPEFNLSHSSDEVLLAVARGMRVGVDLERIEASIDPDALGKMVLAPEEASLLEGFAGLEQKRAFLRVWCRKEACLKAAGVGLIDDLTSLSVAFDRADLSRCRDRRIDPREAPILYPLDLQIGPRHVAALATTTPCAPFEATPLLELQLSPWL